MIQKYFLNWRILAGTIILFFAGCKDPYYPKVDSSSPHYLVVEGFINPEGATNIRLTRTRAISKGDTASYINETGATVSIEDNNGIVYPLYDNGGGNYLAGYSLNENFLYRLHITTKDNKQYVSTFVACKDSPPIDDLGWRLSDGNVQLYVSTHDENNKSTFYRWDFVDTWEYHSSYYTYYIYDPVAKKVVDRPFPVYVCYRSGNSHQIFVGS
jgi:hypothetical protein